MSNPTELPDLDRVPPSHYSNGPGNVPRLPDRVVDTLIDSAGVSRCAPGRTDITVRDQTAEVEQLVHDVCEELLARLPDNSRAKPEGEAPQAEPERMSTDESREYLIKFMEQHFTDKTYHRYIRGEHPYPIAGDFAWQMARALRMLESAPAAILAPLCGAQHAESADDALDRELDGYAALTERQLAKLDEVNGQHAESGKEGADKGMYGLLETLLRPYGVFDVAIVNAHAENQRDFFALKDRARATLAAQQAAAPGALEIDRGALELANSALIASEPKFAEGWPRHERAIHLTSCALNKPTAAPSAPGTPEAPVRQPELSVWYGAMPESNGKSNFTAILKRKDAGPFDTCHITIDRSEYPDRVRYEADRVRWLIGEIQEEPFILDYDGDKHSGYKRAAQLDGGQEGSERG